MVYRNVEQLELHLAALENGVGKDSGCKSVDIAVRDLMRIGISAREAKQDRARQQSEHRKAVEKAQDLVEPKRKSIQPFITASMASSTVRAFCCDTALLIHQFSRDGLTSLLLDPAVKHGDGGDGGAGAGEGEGREKYTTMMMSCTSSTRTPGTSTTRVRPRCTCLLVKSTTSASVLGRAARRKVSKESGVFERDQTAPWGWLGPLRL